MSELSALQEWIAESLRRRGALPRNEAMVSQAQQRVTGNQWLRPAEQVEVYREQFWWRHTGSLIEDFPGLGGIVGQADWEKLTEGYLLKHPPRSWTLRDLGQHLPEYIETEATWLPHHRLCWDMARLEWAYTLVFDAADVAPLALQRLAEIPPDAWLQAKISLGPALQRLVVEYPVASLRGEIRKAEADPTRRVPIPEAERQHLVVYRGPERGLLYKRLTWGAFAVLDQLAQGIALIPACERALEVTGASGQQLQSAIGGWFQDWAKRGWITDVTLS